MLSRGTDDDSIQQTMSNSAQEKANENLKLVTDFNVGVYFLSLLFYNFYMVTETYFFFFFLWMFCGCNFAHGLSPMIPAKGKHL